MRDEGAMRRGIVMEARVEKSVTRHDSELFSSPYLPTFLFTYSRLFPAEPR